MEAANSVAQLLFRRKPALSFHSLVLMAERAIASVTSEPHSLTRDHADCVTVDFGGLRIMLGRSDIRPGPYVLCLTLIVGAGPRPGNCSLANRRLALTRLIADRIAARMHPDEILWSRTVGIADEFMLDELAEGLEIVGIQTGSPMERPLAVQQPRAARFAEIDDRMLDHAMLGTEAAFAAIGASLDANLNTSANTAVSVAVPTAAAAAQIQNAGTTGVSSSHIRRRNSGRGRDAERSGFLMRPLREVDGSGGGSAARAGEMPSMAQLRAALYGPRPVPAGGWRALTAARQFLMI